MKNYDRLIEMSKEELEKWKKAREEFKKEDKPGFIVYFTSLISFTIFLLFYAYFKAEIIRLTDYGDIPFTCFGLGFIAYIGYLISSVLFDMKIQYIKLRSRNIFNFKIISARSAVVISTLVLRILMLKKASLSGFRRIGRLLYSNAERYDMQHKK